MFSIGCAFSSLGCLRVRRCLCFGIFFSFNCFCFVLFRVLSTKRIEFPLTVFSLCIFYNELYCGSFQNTRCNNDFDNDFKNKASYVVRTQTQAYTRSTHPIHIYGVLWKRQIALFLDSKQSEKSVQTYHPNRFPLLNNEVSLSNASNLWQQFIPIHEYRPKQSILVRSNVISWVLFLFSFWIVFCNKAFLLICRVHKC